MTALETAEELAARHKLEIEVTSARHASELRLRRFDMEANVRLRAFEAVNPYALASIDDDEVLDQTLKAADRIAQWALHGPEED